MEEIIVGLPKGLLYYKYKDLWINFFNELGITTIISDDTNKTILENGINKAVDETCLSLKIFLGHVDNLKNKVNYVLIPRIVSLKKKEKLCTNFSALYDIVNNIFNINILYYNVDVDKDIDEKKAFIDLGKQLGISRQKSIGAYKKAKMKQKEIFDQKLIKQNNILSDSNLKILLVGHPYNLYDEFIGMPVIRYLEDNDIVPIYSDIYDKFRMDYECSLISSTIYWTYNKELLGAISHFKNNVDGIIIISTFPCGPDSLVNEMITRKIKDIPIISIIVDELNNDAGLVTRLESFIDVIKDKKGCPING